MDVDEAAVEMAVRAELPRNWDSLRDDTKETLRAVVRRHLTALTDAGWVLLPPGGQVREEWRVMYRNGLNSRPFKWASDSDLGSPEEALKRCRAVGYVDVWKETRMSAATLWAKAEEDKG